MGTQGQFTLGELRLKLGQKGELFSINLEDQAKPEIIINTPEFEVNRVRCNDFLYTGEWTQRELSHGGYEYQINYISEGDPALHLKVFLRGFPRSPIIRMRFQLSSDQEKALTKTDGHDQITYLSVQSDWLDQASLAEVQLSHFDPVAHSYLPNRVDRKADEVINDMSFVGPVALFHTERKAFLTAYEHGADHPNSFINFVIGSLGKKRYLKVVAHKGNYYQEQKINPDRPFESVWFELGLVNLPEEDFWPMYRNFFMQEICENNESRQPFIYYNTWNYQERQRYFKNRPYLESMTQERILEEIEIAHRIGVDIFVIDTGWYKKTGDWLVNLDRFPDGLYTVKKKLDRYGMRLGLWFNPTVAAITSKIYLEHPEYAMTHDERPTWRGSVWETEESVSMCLASDYADYFIKTMVRLNHELGVAYFKWDGVGQYGCNSPLHHHGNASNTAAERADCYAYLMGRQMIRIVDEVTRQCPKTIVDFDITEGGRFVGLGFLSVGKFFLINNGPYFSDFNIPSCVSMVPNTINVFFYPGPARPRICRQGAKFDWIIPSILFLTHYLPDPPRVSQVNSLASLVLGGNGWWGDLPSLDEKDIRFLGDNITNYKRVAKAVTSAFPKVQGFAGSSPEVHEKIDPISASGIVVFFTVNPGTIAYLTQPINTKNLHEVVGADRWAIIGDDRVRITVNLERNGAQLVYLIGE